MRSTSENLSKNAALLPFQASLEALGRKALQQLETLGGQWLLIFRTVQACVFLSKSQRKYLRRVTAMQIYFSGCQALGLVGWLAIATGAVIIFYTSSEATALKSSEVSVRLLYLVAVKEVGPLLCALAVIARSGTAVASEIGAMKVGMELDALRAVGTHPLTFIVLPRVAAGVVSQLCLVTFFSAIAMMGGYLVSLLQQPMTVSFFVWTLSDQLSVSDFVILFLKAVGTGAAIFGSACFFGLRVEKSSHEIPQATTRAVVAAIGGVLVWCVALSIVHLNLMGGRGL